MFTPSHSENSYETQWLANNTDDDSSKDYYVKYEEDSGFRNFVKTLMLSSSDTNIKSSKKNNKKLDKLHKSSGNRDNITNGNKDKDNIPKCNKDPSQKISNPNIVPKSNDDIQTSRGKYQDMVKDRWGDKRRLDSRIDGGKCVEVRCLNFMKERVN